MSQIHPSPINKYLLTIRAPAQHIEGIKGNLIHNIWYVGPLTDMCSKRWPANWKSFIVFHLVCFFTPTLCFYLFRVERCQYLLNYLLKSFGISWFIVFMVASKRISKAPREIYPEVASVIKPFHLRQKRKQRSKREASRRQNKADQRSMLKIHKTSRIFNENRLMQELCKLFILHLFFQKAFSKELAWGL